MGGRKAKSEEEEEEEGKWFRVFVNFSSGGNFGLENIGVDRLREHHI